MGVVLVATAYSETTGRGEERGLGRCEGDGSLVEAGLLGRPHCRGDMIRPEPGDNAIGETTPPGGVGNCLRTGDPSGVGGPLWLKVPDRRRETIRGI